MMMVMTVTITFYLEYTASTDCLSWIEFKHTNSFRLMIPMFDMYRLS
jgi:hypothetical protein